MLTERFTREEIKEELAAIAETMMTQYLEKERDEEERKNMLVCFTSLMTIYNNI